MEQAWSASRSGMLCVFSGLLENLRVLYPKAKVFLTLGAMLNDSWPTAETKSLSHARDAIMASMQALPADKQLHFLEYPNQVRHTLVVRRMSSR